MQQLSPSVDIQDTPRIYVACLAAYNSGILHGKWIDANQDADDIWSEVQEMLKQSPCPGAEEWAIHDYEGFEGIKLSEWESFETISRLAELLQEHGSAFADYYADTNDLEYAANNFEEAYCGEWDDEKAFAEEIFSSGHEIPDYLEPYIDWDSVARDLFIGDYWSARSPEGIFVFRRM